MLLSELNEDQVNHLFWRLNNKTGCGMSWSRAMAQGQHGDLDLVEVFEKAGCSRRSAQAHARLTAQFRLDPVDKAFALLAQQATVMVAREGAVGSLSPEQVADLALKVGHALIEFGEGLNKTLKRNQR